MSDEAYEEVTAPDAIAVVGIAGRFPGADDVDAFWRNIRASKVSISHFTDEELEDDFSPEVRASEAYVRARSVLENVDHFDAGFFGMYPREASPPSWATKPRFCGRVTETPPAMAMSL